MRNQWETGGFTFRPKSIRRDRVVCEVCEPVANEKAIGVFAILTAMQPQYYHDMSKHAAGYAKELADKGLEIIQYGKRIPVNEAQLRAYLVSHIDAYAFKNQQTNSANTWNHARVSRGDVFGFAHFANYLIDPESYTKNMSNPDTRHFIEESYPPAPKQTVTGVIKPYGVPYEVYSN